MLGFLIFEKVCLYSRRLGILAFIHLPPPLPRLHDVSLFAETSELPPLYPLKFPWIPKLRDNAVGHNHYLVVINDALYPVRDRDYRSVLQGIGATREELDKGRRAKAAPHYPSSP